MFKISKIDVLEEISNVSEKCSETDENENELDTFFRNRLRNRWRLNYLSKTVDEERDIWNVNVEDEK